MHAVTDAWNIIYLVDGDRAFPAQRVGGFGYARFHVTLGRHRCPGQPSRRVPLFAYSTTAIRRITTTVTTMSYSAISQIDVLSTAMHLYIKDTQQAANGRIVEPQWRKLCKSLCLAT
jgi:hypothetical protein